jgi:hypothetical protein
MKYKLLFLLLLTTKLLTKPIIHDLDKQGRTGSSLLNQLNKISDENIIIEGGTGYQTLQRTRTIYFECDDFNLYEESFTDVPFSIKINEYDYSLKLKPSKNIFYYGVDEINSKSDIKCTYRAGQFKTMKKEFPKKAYKKELIVEDTPFVLSLTDFGALEVSLIQMDLFVDLPFGHKFTYYNNIDEELDGLIIRDFFVGKNEKKEESIVKGYYILILTEDNLLYRFSLEIWYWQPLHKQLKISKQETINLRDAGLEFDNAIHITYKFDLYYIFLKNGYYKLRNGKDKTLSLSFREDLWRQRSEVIGLNNIEVIRYSHYACILIKGYGLALIELSEKGEDKTLGFFEHKHIVGLAPSKFSKNTFNIGAFVDNQRDKDVKEFFIEIGFNTQTAQFYLSRAFISSQRITSVQTDSRGFVTMFLIGTTVYIVPRTVFNLNSLPIYTYTGVNVGDRLRLVSRNYKQDADMMAIIMTNDNEGQDEVITFTRTKNNRESYKCLFPPKEGYYQIKNEKFYLRNSHSLELSSISILLEAEETEEEKKKRLEEERRIAEEKRLEEEKRIAEEKRLEEEKRIAEEKRLEEEKRKAEEKGLEEEKRIAEEKRLEEEKRKAEEKRLEEERRIAEEKRLEEEKRKAEEKRLEEERRIAEEKRVAEEKRIAEEKRLEEEKRKAEEQRIIEEKRVAEEKRKAEEKRLEDERRKAEEKRVADEKQPKEEEIPGDKKQETESSGNTILIVVIIILALVLIIVAVAVILYVRRKKRQLSSPLIEAQNYEDATQPPQPSQLPQPPQPLKDDTIDVKY